MQLGKTSVPLHFRTVQTHRALARFSWASFPCRITPTPTVWMMGSHTKGHIKDSQMEIFVQESSKSLLTSITKGQFWWVIGSEKEAPHASLGELRKRLDTA